MQKSVPRVAQSFSSDSRKKNARSSSDVRTESRGAAAIIIVVIKERR